MLPVLRPIPRRRDAPGQRPPSESFTTFGFLRRFLPLGALELLGFALALAARRAAKSMTSVLELVVVGFAAFVDGHGCPLCFLEMLRCPLGRSAARAAARRRPTSTKLIVPERMCARSVRSLTPRARRLLASA